MSEAAPAPPAKFAPGRYLAIRDISLWSTSLERGNAEYVPAVHQESLAWQTMRGLAPEMLTVGFKGGEESLILRVKVALGVRCLTEEQEEGQEDEDKILFKLEAVFAVLYEIQDETYRPTQEEFNDFVNFNCVHNAWPFWRQHVFDTLKRASLPVPEIPFFAGRPAEK